MKKAVLRAVVEVGVIMFLFYANLLMGEYSHSGAGRRKGFVWALCDVFTEQNFFIGVIAALIGYLVVKSLRRKL